MRTHLKILVGAALVAALGIPTLATARVERIPQREARRDAGVTTDVARPAIDTRLPSTASLAPPSVLADPRSGMVILQRDNGLFVAASTVIGADGLSDEVALTTTPKRPQFEALTPSAAELAMSPVPAVRNIKVRVLMADGPEVER